ncbi:putative pre-16S rRNA nuclease [Methylopila jiangsuensis]|uniref:Putative pre-16S rRNA nuclease n=1 Tax=Methylopila jiangsuensis TaxID=586230 RepID=A0A9W6JDW3_9HYPH|nr:Holliday junction resolvase RuvX [Methylopila jiangsuensis]MDR6286023.1 putative Holliday junction resolvase [Methylopila jiangsuensis]GLK75780.1 putative pre-16S rRNA nuclease [Methylopila jiangsuensis]
MSSVFDDFHAFVAALPARGSLIGLDLGTKTLGVAVSDPSWMIASPVETIMRKKFTPDVDRMLQIADSRKAVGVVLGLPVNMDGTEGPRCQSTRAFARSLSGRTPLPIGFWDERLSTAAVERMLISFDATRKRRAEVVDKLAAAYILQGAIDRMSALRRAADDAS